MDYLRRVQTAIDYIEANLDCDIDIASVARQAGLSRWHFQRIFKALANETVKTYIRSRRLANSLDKLLTGDQKILDIALAAGYESQESFTLAFKKAFDMTPGEYRKIGDKSLYLKKIQFDADYLRHINQNVSIEPEIYEQPAMRLVGLRTPFYSVDSEKNNIAEKLPPLWDAFLERLDEIEYLVPKVGYGVIRQNRTESEQLEYIAAAQVSRQTRLPDDMVSLEIPSSTYARFVHRGPVKDLNNTVNYIYSSWLLQSGRRHTCAADIEIYGADYHPTSERSVIHYAIPIK